MLLAPAGQGTAPRGYRCIFASGSVVSLTSVTVDGTSWVAGSSPVAKAAARRNRFRNVAMGLVISYDASRC